VQTRFSFRRRILTLAFTLPVALAAGACEYNSNGPHGGHRGKGGGKGVCYERVLDIDRKTGQTHYVDRAIPCPK